MPQNKILVSQLFLHPIKSCHYLRVNKFDITQAGPQFDRHWMLVDQMGQFLTQRNHPRMALIKPAIDSAFLTVDAPQMDTLRIPLVRNEGKRMRVTIWGDTCEATDNGDEIANWFSAFLGITCRLVHLADNFERRLDPEYAGNTSSHTRFADGFPELILSENSMNILNAKMETPLPITRFRPNIVVKGCDAFAEDTWRLIQIGNVQFDIVKSCVRCVITTTDQDTAERRSKEPLKSLATFRNTQKGVI
ncbi:MAG: MOSC domain-containing protein, partial [Calditrichaeota bacterium]